MPDFYLIILFLSQVYRNERQMITSPSLEAAKKAGKKLTLVPLVLLFLRSWGMLRFCIYLTSSVNKSESIRKAQHILLYFQVSVKKKYIFFERCLRVKYRKEMRLESSEGRESSNAFDSHQRIIQVSVVTLNRITVSLRLIIARQFQLTNLYVPRFSCARTSLDKS